MTPRHLHRTAAERRAFTLLEIMLTLGIIVAVAVLAWPALDRALIRQRLLKAADRIRAEWCGARVDAMESGQNYVFRYAPEGDRFQIRPQATEVTGDQELFGDVLADVPGVGVPSGQNAEKPPKLPEGVVFLAGETAADTRAAMAVSEGDQTNALASGWSNPILFYPDGTTSTARLVLRNERNRCIELNLRGLTGTVTVGEICMVEELAR